MRILKTPCIELLFSAYLVLNDHMASQTYKKYVEIFVVECIGI